jgi:hypothetical protein
VHALGRGALAGRLAYELGRGALAGEGQWSMVPDEPTAAGRAFADLDTHVIAAPSLRLDVEALDATPWS